MKAKKIFSIITAVAIAVSNVYMPVYAEEMENTAVAGTDSETGRVIISELEETIYNKESAEISENEEMESEETETQREKDSEREYSSEIKSELQESVTESGNSTEESTEKTTGDASQEEAESKTQESTVAEAGETAEESTAQKEENATAEENTTQEEESIAAEENTTQEEENVTAKESTTQEEESRTVAESTEITEETNYMKNEQAESDYQYSVNGGEITITGYTGSDKDLLVPAEIDGKKVTSIGYRAFYGCSSLESIILPDGVVSIESYAFYGCSSLESIAFPEGLTSIGSCAFYGCSSLESIVFPEGLTSIGSYAFSLCSSLKSINLPEGITNIEGVFSGCSSLESINLPEGITSIEGVFSGCSSLESINLPEGITNIYRAFDGCSSLKSINLPEGITNIAITFRRCSSLESIVLPEGITNIENAFDFCSSLKSITLPEGLTSIGSQTFRGCSSLESIILPNGIVKIEDETFNGCSSLKSINLPEGITSIGSEAFYGCSSLESIVFPEGLTSIESESFYGCSSIESIVFPEGLTSIGREAFDSCSSLKSITFPEGITSIGSDAFSGCSSLESINIPEGITNIGSSAFYGCSSLSSIRIPSGVTYIKYETFYGCSGLRSVTIPKSVTRIGDLAFSECSERIDVYYEGTREEWNQIRQPALGSDDEEGSGLKYSYGYYDSDNDIEVTYEGNNYVYIHHNCVISSDNRLESSITIDSDKQSYTKMYGDADFRLEGISKTGDGTLAYTVTSGKDVVEVSQSGMVTIKNTGRAVITVSMEATENYKKARSKTISIIVNKKAVQIESDYLYKIEGNGEITITEYTGTETNILVPAQIEGKKVTGIGNGAFSGCEILQSVILPEGITSIENDAFSGCETLQSIILPAGLTSIGSYAFESCMGLKSINLPEGLTSIGSGAFCGCSSLGSIIIPRGVTHIKDETFYECSGLRSITIPKSVTRIGGEVFYFDTDTFVDVSGSVIDIYYEGTSEEWKQIKKSAEWFSSPDVSYEIHYNSNISDDTLLDSFITIVSDKQNYTKTYGDAAFQLEGISKTGDGTLVYTVSSGKDVVEVSPSGRVTINHAGSAVITVSMAATDTYKEAESKTISITVNKKTHTNVAPQTVQLNYEKGSNGKRQFDFSKLIAQDAGSPFFQTYNIIDNDNIFTSTNLYTGTGIFEYAVRGGDIGMTASVEVVAAMGNYTDCKLILQINLVEKEESNTEESSGSEESSSIEESSGSEESSSTEESSGSEEKGDTFSVSTIAPQAYTGKAIKPDVTVTHNGRRLVPGQDYTVIYKNNTKAGTATVTVRGKGNYSETQTVSFAIERKDLNSSGIIIDDLALAYNAKGKIQKKAPTVTYNGKKLKEGTDYTVSYGDGSFQDAGTYTVTINGKGNFKGEASGRVVIVDKSMIINNAKVVLSQKKCDYTGSEIKPSITVMLKAPLVENKDYTVSYADNIMPGKATVIIKGKGIYAGTKKVHFTINKQVVNLTQSMVSIPVSVVYEKGGCTPEPTVTVNGMTLTKGIDYTVSYKNNKKTGTAAIVVKGKGIYKGTVNKNFTIAPKDISKTFMRAPDVVYTVKTGRKAGRYISKPVLTDTNGNVLSTSDYMNVVYKCGSETLNKKSTPAVGSVIKVTVTGKGNYTGTASTEYVLKDALPFTKTKVSISDKTYTGGKVTLKPDDIKVIMKKSILKYGKDYEIIASSYRNNNKKGTAQVTIRGKGDYAGEQTVKFKITTRKISVK